MQKNGSVKNPLNWFDLVLSGVLCVPLVWVLTIPEWQSGEFLMIAYTLAIYGSPPVVYLLSRILGCSRKHAVSLGILVPVEVIFVGWNIVVGRPFIGLESDIGLIALLGVVIIGILLGRGEESKLEGQEIAI